MNLVPLSRGYLLTVANCGSRTEILSTLQAIDPNGTWGDAESEAEGIDPLSLEDAATALRSLISELPE